MTTGFSAFYDAWYDHHHHLIHKLSITINKKDHETLPKLVETVTSHYSEYYRVKSLASERDPLTVFSAPWASSLERSLHWIAGWRPTTGFHLIYSEASILFESRIIDILQGLRTGDLSDLSPSQLQRVSELQCQTVEEENAITEELSEWQDDASGLLGACTDLNERIGNLIRILKKADDLRLKTIERVVDLLTKKQSAEFLVAAAELQFGIRGWGLKQDLEFAYNTTQPNNQL